MQNFMAKYEAGRDIIRVCRVADMDDGIRDYPGWEHFAAESKEAAYNEASAFFRD